jgi:hypothetical protein
VRWTRRRLRYVRRLLTTLIGLMPQRFAGCQPTLASFRETLGRSGVLVALRAVAADHLAQLAVPVGFGGAARLQQRTGPDPPSDRRDGRS